MHILDVHTSVHYTLFEYENIVIVDDNLSETLF